MYVQLVFRYIPSVSTATILGVGGIIAAVRGREGGLDPLRLLHSERQIRHWYIQQCKPSASYLLYN